MAKTRPNKRAVTDGRDRPRHGGRGACRCPGGGGGHPAGAGGVEFTCREEVLALGLDGLEAYYLDFSEAQRAELAALAGQQGLYCTAGSDCHGFAHRDRMGLPCSPALLAALPPVLRG